MEATETPNGQATGETLANRVRLINTATGGLFDALLKLNHQAGDDALPPPALTIMEYALTLANCGLIALTEIADAQQRMVALAERDFSSEVAAAIDDAAEAKANVKVAETTRRSFIGQKKDGA